MALHETLQGTRFGEWLRAARRQKGMTLAALGARLNLHAGRISEWERGTKIPSDAEKARILEVLESALPSTPVSNEAPPKVQGSQGSVPRLRPWDARREDPVAPGEVLAAEELGSRLLARTNGRPWSPSWLLLAEDDNR